jgi:hypothetical protein
MQLTDAEEQLIELIRAAHRRELSLTMTHTPRRNDPF